MTARDLDAAVDVYNHTSARLDAARRRLHAAIDADRAAHTGTKGELRHGTDSRYRQHLADGDQADCPACTEAHRIAMGRPRTPRGQR